MPKKIVEEYVDRISTHYKNLSNAEKRIADYILSNKGEILDMSVQSLAKKTETGAATVVRFCRSLGFNGYKELKYYIEQELLTPLGIEEQFDKNDSIKVIKQKLFNFNKKVIDDTFLMLKNDQLEQAVDVLCKSENIVFFAEGGSGASALNAYNLFLQLGLNCSFINDTIIQILAASNVKQNDVVIGISHSGRTISTIDALNVAKNRGATTICITGYANSKITEYADIILYTSSKSVKKLSDLPVARISEMCVISILYAGITAKKYDDVGNSMKRANEVMKVKRTKR